MGRKSKGESGRKSRRKTRREEKGGEEREREGEGCAMAVWGMDPPPCQRALV